MLSTEKQNLEDFQPALDKTYTPGSALKTNIFMMKFEMHSNNKILHLFNGITYDCKQAVTPLVDKILFTKKAKTNQDIVDIAEKYFKYKVDHTVTFFNKANL